MIPFRHSLVAMLVALTLDACGQTGTFLDRWDADDIRVVTYNVYWDSIFADPSTSELPRRFARVINALQPDVIALQEIRQGADATAALLDSLAPLPDGQNWHAHGWSDNVILSPYPFLLETGSVGHADVLVDLPNATYAKDLFVLSDHLPCCNNEAARQEEADRIIRWLEDGRTSGGDYDLPADTPMLVVGDLNIVRSGRPLETILTGDIFNNAWWGADSPPDWDGTSLVDARPWHNGVGPNNYTWRSDIETFDPGVLDFVLYTDSVLETANSFVLEPADMTPEELLATGLQPYDVQLDETVGWWDHLPVVVDFRLKDAPLPGDYNGDGEVDALDYNAWRDAFGESGAGLAADGNGDGLVDAADYTVWRDALEATDAQAIPEPSAGLLALMAAGLVRRQRRTPHRGAGRR